jgi:hypothetical protein
VTWKEYTPELIKSNATAKSGNTNLRKRISLPREPKRPPAHVITDEQVERLKVPDLALP